MAYTSGRRWSPGYAIVTSAPGSRDAIHPAGPSRSPASTGHSVLGGERLAAEAQAREPGLHQGVVVVAAHEDHGLARGRLGERVEERPRDLEQVRHGTLAHLEEVAEQDDPVGRRERLRQPLERVGSQRDVGAADRAEVEVRDQRRPHGADGDG